MSEVQPERTEYEEVHASAEFQELRSRFRRFVFPLTGLFLAWYFLYVILSAYAPDFMSTKVFGRVNLGLIIGLLQFVSTFAITMAYARWADREFAPPPPPQRAQLEAGEVK